MNKKLMVGVLIPLMILIVAVYGYAAFTSTATLTVTATSGSVDCVFTSWTVYSAPSYTSTSFGGGASALTVTTGPLAPGDTVIIEFYIYNSGNLPATVSTAVTAVSSPCPLTYSDTVGGTVGPGATVGPFYAYITLNAGLGNGYETMSFSFTVTLTGTAGT